ncbi:hypothetical protein [Streptomyces turgidiscabies]|uniref:hypothetical protein n=1 Tax=Streptomyces turgidiscabies TaxID=85558 RepID=UPI0027D779CA|nr:hypothetical protein [Streptomyces turgidiscabies]
MTVSTAPPVVVPAPERERHVRQDRAAHEVPARVSRAQEAASGPQSVLLAGEDEDACRREPHIWRGID